jgi:putative ABC transport system permease protein
MSWFGPVRTATGGLMRHKVQAVVIGMVLLVSTASATLGLALLAAGNAPFQHSFAAQHGADLAVTVNPARATAAQLDATRALRGVTATAGPFAEATVQLQYQGQPWGQLTLAGRASPGGPVDDAVLTDGHWPDAPGQVVLDNASVNGGLEVGNTLTITGGPGGRSLTVVGFANSVTDTADGWVVPGEIGDLQAPGTPPSAQLLYRFASAGSAAQVHADLAEVTGALPPGTVTGSYPWQSAESQNTSNGAIMEPFVVAFAVIGLVMAVLIVANVVSGAVAAQYYRIGVLKSIGMSPGQVIMVYLGRTIIPAIVGVVIGVVVGNILAVPLLSTSASSVMASMPSGARTDAHHGADWLPTP